MSELIATDNDGVRQFVWMQERGDTCGPACVYMLERMRRNQSVAGGEQRVTFLTSLLPKGYREGVGTESYTALKRVLDQLGMPAMATKVSNIPAFIKEGWFPFITRVAWSTGGAHFVVAAKVTKSGHLVCLDPWYGLVQPVLAGLPHYSVQQDYRKQMSYLAPITGTLSGHMVFQNAMR